MIRGHLPRLILLIALMVAASVVFVPVASETVSRFRAPGVPADSGPDVPTTPIPDSYFELARKSEQMVASEATGYLDAANNGDPKAQFVMGVVRFVGTQDFPVDYARAADWFRKSANGGDAMAPVRLSFHLLRGLGVEKNPVEAVRWLRVAMERGNPEGAYELANVYRMEYGPLPRNPEKAFDLYIQAARDGSRESAMKLGQIHYYGSLGVTRDFREAAKWFKRVAEWRHYLAYRYLATIYTEERGSAYDPVEGLNWLIVDDETDLMPQYLQDRREKLRAALSPAQIAEAERRATAWLEEHRD